jgi:putative transcriptional regulator
VTGGYGEQGPGGTARAGAVWMTGALLVATPELVHPEFARTVVLLLDHGPDGAVGVVLNRPLEVAVSAELPDWATCQVLAEPAVLFDGGPVETGTVLMVALARPGVAAGVPDVRAVTPRVVVVPFSAEPQDAPDWAEGLRVFAGYAGWGAGQLEDELAGGFWYLIESMPEDLVAAAPHQLWRTVLRRQRGELALVSAWTAQPELN